MKAFLNQSCDQGPNHDTCIVVWSNLQQLSNTSIEAVTYGVSDLNDKLNNIEFVYILYKNFN